MLLGLCGRLAARACLGETTFDVLLKGATKVPSRVSWHGGTILGCPGAADRFVNELFPWKVRFFVLPLVLALALVPAADKPPAPDAASLAPANVRTYVPRLPQDVDPVAVEPTGRGPETALYVRSA